MKKPVWLALGLLWVNVLAGAQEFYIKGEVETGKTIPERIARSLIPFDKSWDQLSTDQRAVFRSNYDGLPAEIEPPFPKQGLAFLVETAIEMQKRIQSEGELFAVAVVNSQGQAESVSLYASPGEEWKQVIPRLLVETEFKPAQCAGAPCKMEFILHLDLTSKKDFDKPLSTAVVINVPSQLFPQRTPFNR